ncbi:MAG: cation transporter [Actinomycetota bacterium]
MAQPDAERYRDLRHAVAASRLSIGWSVLAGTAAVAVGLRAGALSLLAYGLDATVDAAASAMILRDLHGELRGGHPPTHRRAERTVGFALVLIGAAVSAQAVRELVAGKGPNSTTIGIVIAVASMLILPPLSAYKIKLGGRLRSPALKGDGFLTGAGGALAAVTLIGMVLDRTLGLWWADPVAAVLISILLVIAGIVTLRDRGSHSQT